MAAEFFDIVSALERHGFAVGVIPPGATPEQFATAARRVRARAAIARAAEARRRSRYLIWRARELRSQLGPMSEGAA